MMSQTPKGQKQMLWNFQMPILGAYLKGSLAPANDFLFCGQERGYRGCPDQYSGPVPGLILLS